jgi:hypothetical protein
LPRKVILEYPIRVLRESDEDFDECVGCVDGVQRESQFAVLLRVSAWGSDVWFPRAKLRLDDDIIYCEREMYEEKKRDHSNR